MTREQQIIQERKVMKCLTEWENSVHISKNTSYDMFDDSEYMHDKDRQNINSIPEKFHAANAHDIMEYLMGLWNISNEYK